jgi:hypothetical protein
MLGESIIEDPKEKLLVIGVKGEGDEKRMLALALERNLFSKKAQPPSLPTQKQ